MEKTKKKENTSKKKDVISDFLSQYNTKSELENALNKLIEAESDENVDLKTEIHQVRAITVLTVFRDFVKSMNLSKSYATLQSFLQYYLRYMISHNRESRKEFIEALKLLIANNEENKELKEIVK